MFRDLFLILVKSLLIDAHHPETPLLRLLSLRDHLDDLPEVQIGRHPLIVCLIMRPYFIEVVFKSLPQEYLGRCVQIVGVSVSIDRDRPVVDTVVVLVVCDIGVFRQEKFGDFLLTRFIHCFRVFFWGGLCVVTCLLVLKRLMRGLMM